jgi:hypothetical protein
VPTDPRLGGVVLGITDLQMVALASLRQEVADLRREVRDQRSAATIQIGVASPAGLAARDGAPYGRTTAEFWVKFPTGWRGVSLPLT